MMDRVYASPVWQRGAISSQEDGWGRLKFSIPEHQGYDPNWLLCAWEVYIQLTGPRWDTRKTEPVVRPCQRSVLTGQMGSLWFFGPTQSRCKWGIFPLIFLCFSNRSRHRKLHLSKWMAEGMAAFHLRVLFCKNHLINVIFSWDMVSFKGDNFQQEKLPETAGLAGFLLFLHPNSCFYFPP